MMLGNAAVRNGALNTVDGKRKPISWQKITDLSTVTSLTVPPVTDNPQIVLVQPEGANVRWRDDGGNPSSSIGMLLTAGSFLEYNGDINAIKFIEVSASATLNVLYYA